MVGQTSRGVTRVDTDTIRHTLILSIHVPYTLMNDNYIMIMIRLAHTTIFNYLQIAFVLEARHLLV